MAGLCSQTSSNGIVIDSSPPVPGFVSIGAENVKYIPQRSSLALEWGNFADIQSGIVHYEICVGTSKLNCNILRWKNVRLEQTALLLNLALPTNQDLYAVVKATNRVGLSTRQTSHSFRVDDTPPTVTKLPRFISSEDASSIYDSSVVRVEWGFDDKESPIKMTLLSLRLQDGAHSEIDNIVVNSKDMFVRSLSSKEWLKDGDSYYVVVTSCNMAGLCESIKSETVVFDGTPPIHGHVLDEGTWSNANSTIILKWKSYDDPESGINSYFITIGKTHNGMEISRGIVNVVHNGDEKSIQTGVFNISQLIKSGDKIVFSIWARNKASLNGTIRRLTFIAVSNDQNNTGGNLIVERHSCSVSYCTNECTCTILGGKCNHIQNTHECTKSNNSQMSVNSKIALRILGSPSDDWTSSTRCLGVEWHSQNITVLRYEWSIGLNHMPYGYGIFDTTIEQIWHDISLQTGVVYCLPKKRQLLNGRQYVAYLRTWVTENEYILTQSKPIIIDTTRPSIRRGRFIIDSDAECIRDKEFANNKALKTCWKGVFVDEQSGIKEFRMMIGVSPGGHEISGIQSVGLATNFSWNFPDLEPGVKYYSSVEAVNFVGQSTKLTSDGITIDSTPPDSGIVFTTKFFHNERWLKETSAISASWEGFTDFESSIDHYILSVIDADQNVIVQDLNVGFLNKYTITDLLLIHGMSYFINVRAVDMAGHISNISRSEAITVDKTMPEGILCKTFLEHSNVTTKILTNQKQVIKDVFRLNHSTLYKVVIDGELDIDIHDMVIDIDGNLYEVALNEHSSEISFMSKTSTSDIGVYVNSPQNQSLSLRITMLECKVSEISDIEALVVRQISPNFLTIAANVMDKESEIRHVEMYFGTHSRGRQLKTIKATSPFTIHKVFMPISHGTTLHISAMAENNAGFKKYFYSNAIVWDHTPPNLHIKNVSVSYVDENGDTLTLVTVDWKLDENESEVAYCQCAFGNEVASQNLQSWEMSRDLFSCQSRLSIPHGSIVFPSVQCFNRVGLQTVVNRNLPVIVSFDSPRPLSKDVHFVVNSVKVQNSVNVQQISTTLYFHWPVFSDISGISKYSVCIKSDNLVVYDWQSIGRHNYFSADEILLDKTRNYTVLVSGTNVGGRTSDPINGSISVIDIVPVQTGNSCLANETINGNVFVTWTDVFSLTTEMEPYYIVYLGSDVGFSDLLQNFKTSNTEYLLSTKPKQVYAVITAKYATGSESTYRELININNF
nr:uncharacterized protein LOC117688823 isoform X2 [Crassostrea gigas]